MKSSIFTEAAISAVIQALAPGIKGLIALHNRKNMYVVVKVFGSGHGNYEFAFGGLVAGDSPGSPEPYSLIALAKAELCERTQMNSGKVMSEFPHLLEQGDVIYGGGVYFPGLIVAASGAQEQIDEAIAMMIATALMAGAKLDYIHLRADAEQGSRWAVPKK